MLINDGHRHIHWYSCCHPCGTSVSEEHLYYDVRADLKHPVINKCWPIRRAMVVVIILLHALITVNFSTTWSKISWAFIKNEQNFATLYLALTSAAARATSWEAGITSCISTVLTDLYMVCATLLGIYIISPFFDSRFGVAGWSGTTLGCCSASHIFPDVRNW